MQILIFRPPKGPFYNLIIQSVLYTHSIIQYCVKLYEIFTRSAVILTLNMPVSSPPLPSRSSSLKFLHPGVFFLFVCFWLISDDDAPLPPASDLRHWTDVILPHLSIKATKKVFTFFLLPPPPPQSHQSLSFAGRDRRRGGKEGGIHFSRWSSVFW